MVTFQVLRMTRTISLNLKKYYVPRLLVSVMTQVFILLTVLPVHIMLVISIINVHTGHGPYSHMFDHKVVRAVVSKEVNIYGKCVSNGWLNSYAFQESYIFPLFPKGVKKHETLSVDIFERMLVKNPKVLAEFICEGLTKEHVRLIGEMIQPPDKDKRTYPQWMFLYEVARQIGVDF